VSDAKPYKGLPEKLQIQKEYDGAYHRGVGIEIHVPGFDSGPFVGDFIPACNDRCTEAGDDCAMEYEVNALATEVVRRWNSHAGLVAACRKMLKSTMLDTLNERRAAGIIDAEWAQAVMDMDAALSPAGKP